MMEFQSLNDQPGGFGLGQERLSIQDPQTTMKNRTWGIVVDAIQTPRPAWVRHVLILVEVSMASGRGEA